MKKINNMMFSEGDKIVIIKDKKLLKIYEKKLLNSIKDSTWMKKYM